MVDGRLHGALAAVDDEHDHRLGLDHADRGDLVPDHFGDAPRQGFRRLRQPHGHDIVEPAFGQRFQQQRGLGVGVIAPRHADGMQPVATGGRDRFGPQNRGGRLLRGLQWRRMPAGHDLKGFTVDRGAVGVLSLDEDQADGGRGYR